MKLRGKVAVVTGGGRGIGKAIALAFAREGAHIAPISRQGSSAEVQAVSKEAEALGVKALPLSADVSLKADVQTAIQQAIDTFGRVDILVNNAGIAKHNPVADIVEEDWDRTMAVNLKGVFLCCQAVMPVMMKQQSGSIINISSMAGKRGSVGYAAYSASKFGVMGLTESLAREARPHGIRVHSLCPGPVSSVLRASNHPEDVVGNLMLPEDVAEIAILMVTMHPRASMPEVHLTAMWT